MLLSILKWSRGYLTILLRGTSPERFMNLCRNKGILLWNMHTSGRYCICNISIDGFRQLPPIVRKTGTRPVIQRKCGLPFYIQRYRNRTGFVAGMLLCLFFLYYSSLFVWKITVDGNFTHTQEEIVKFLKIYDIMPGIKIEAVDAAGMEEEIRKKFEDIGWVSIEITGTHLYVHLSETNMPVGIEGVKEAESDLVAGHDGIVRSIITREGTPVVEEGQEVKKGDVLVSGRVEILGDSGEVVETRLLAADADILLETKYTYNDTFPLAYEKVEYKENKKTAYGISVFGHTFFIENPLKRIAKFEKYDIIVSENSMHLGKNFILPVTLLSERWREYQGTEAVYTKEEVKALAQEHLSRYLKELEEREVSVLDPKLSLNISKTTATVSGSILVLEPQSARAAVRYMDGGSKNK